MATLDNDTVWDYAREIVLEHVESQDLNAMYVDEVLTEFDETTDMEDSEAVYQAVRSLIENISGYVSQNY